GRVLGRAADRRREPVPDRRADPRNEGIRTRRGGSRPSARASRGGEELPVGRRGRRDPRRARQGGGTGRRQPDAAARGLRAGLLHVGGDGRRAQGRMGRVRAADGVLMPVRVTVAKPGLDGHDRGAKLVARTLRDAGFEVVYLGIRQRPETIAAVAVQEDVRIVGLSILSGAHVGLTEKTAKALRDAGADDVLLVVGGTIPERDVARLEAAGAAAVYPTGTALETLVESLRELSADTHASP